MKVRSLLAMVVTLAVGVPVVCAGPAEEAAAVFAKGTALLTKADFEGALKAYAAAARTDSANTDYRTQYSILRRVITMRDGLAKEQNPEKWQASALALRSFYYSNKLYTEALQVDTQLHSRLKSADSASMLAETQLELGKNADAEKLLSGLDEKASTPQTQILKGIALARQDKMDVAKAVASKVAVPADAGSGILFDLACLKSLTGDTKGAAALLTRCFEQSPPSRIEKIKAYAKDYKDLSATVASADFAAALKAESKVKESKCSGGGDCGSCASKGKCSTDLKAAGVACPDKEKEAAKK
jgi:tetratricopeptide (TPR) repeat protein